MLTFLIVALRWQAVPRNIAIALYTYRLAGFITFEITSDRDILLLFPNVFEYWFIFIAALKTVRLGGSANSQYPAPGSGRTRHPDAGRICPRIHPPNKSHPGLSTPLRLRTS